MTTRRYDTVVVGSGIAGLFTALEATRLGSVAVVTKAALEESNTRYAQGGIAAALFPDDSPRLHERDTLAAGAGLCDPAAVKVMCDEGPARIADLLRHGVAFDGDGDALARGLEAAHSVARILHAGGDATGFHIEKALADAVRAAGIDVYERTFVSDLLVEHGRVRGVRLLAGVIEAGAVVLASGGAGQMYLHTTNPEIATGDGVAAAYRAGAALADLEFFQFHPTALSLPGAPRFLISEAVRGEGALLVDATGTRFCDELAPRDIVARAIWRRMEEQDGEPVRLDARALGADRLRSRFPRIDAFVRSHGVDWASEPVPVTPAAHYWMGGVFTNVWGETTVPGLYACGEAACTGVHGANRLASNSLLEGIVFGARIVDRIDSEKTGRPVWDFGVSPSLPPAVQPLPSRTELQRRMWDDVGLVRTSAGLTDAYHELAQWTVDPETQADHEDANLLLLGSLVTQAALARGESRGAHYRADHPAPAPEWAHRLVVEPAEPAAARAGMTVPAPPAAEVRRLVQAALVEDAPWGDITSETFLPSDAHAFGALVSREDGVLAGLPVAEEAFALCDPAIRFEAAAADGDRLEPGKVAARVEGPARSVLRAERIALNFLQRLSGIATLTSRYVAAVEGTGARIADTRKTTPGLRLLERYAVRVGGGHNHRFSLSDAVLVKDNHLGVLAAAGEDLAAAVARARRQLPHTMKIEVEVDGLGQVEEVLAAGVDIVLLDNFSPVDLRAAVALIAGRAATEASGGVTLDTVRSVAEAGVDVISVGALTHSAPALDLGLDLEVVMNDVIYMDNASTTALSRPVLEAMWPYLTTQFGNPSSHHALGKVAADALAGARAEVARVLGCRPAEVIFTSGGTEGANLAIKGAALARPRGRHVVTTAVEHKAVLEACRALERDHGFRLTVVPVDADGLVDLTAVAEAVTPDSTLVSVMLANNEVGTIQPVAEVADICRRAGVPLHADAVQAPGHLPIGAPDVGADLLSISAHKFGGPKGVGVLYARRGVPLLPQVDGGGQERGRRSGTENVAGIVGLATALSLAEEARASSAPRLTTLRDRLIDGVLQRIPGAGLTGHRQRRLPNHASFCVEDVHGETVLLELEMAGVCCSSGSSCAAGSTDPSHVLTAMGLPASLALTAVRLSLGNGNTDEEVDAVLDLLPRAVDRVRSLASRPA